jgi:hypothetical protein
VGAHIPLAHSYLVCLLLFAWQCSMHVARPAVGGHCFGCAGWTTWYVSMLLGTAVCVGSTRVSAVLRHWIHVRLVSGSSDGSTQWIF